MPTAPLDEMAGGRWHNLTHPANGPRSRSGRSSTSPWMAVAHHEEEVIGAPIVVVLEDLADSWRTHISKRQTARSTSARNNATWVPGANEPGGRLVACRDILPSQYRGSQDEGAPRSPAGHVQSAGKVGSG